MIHIRIARITDAAALANLAQKTFRDTFSKENNPENMDAYCASAYGTAIQAQELQQADLEVFLVEKDTKLIAYAYLREKANPSIQAEKPLEIQRFYVDSNWHGQGVAQTLMQALLERAKICGADTLWLGVWERNPRAKRFYEKHGFLEVGSHVFQLGDDPQRDLIFARASVTL